MGNDTLCIYSLTKSSSKGEKGVWVLIVMDGELLGVKHECPGERVNGFEGTEIDKLAEVGVIRLPSL